MVVRRWRFTTVAATSKDAPFSSPRLPHLNGLKNGIDEFVASCNFNLHILFKGFQCIVCGAVARVYWEDIREGFNSIHRAQFLPSLLCLLN